MRIYSDGIRKRIDDSLGESVSMFIKPQIQQIHFRRHRGRRYYWIGLVGYAKANGGYAPSLERFESHHVKASIVLLVVIIPSMRQPI